MANVVADTGDAGSNLVAGAGTNSATFTMPGTVALNVESVVATVDNAAGGDTTALLTIKDQSGVVIATKRQDDSIPAGDTGTATFALRLDNVGGGIRFNRLNVGSYLDVRATGAGPSGFGIELTSPSGIGVSTINGTQLYTVDAGLWELDANSGAVQINASGGTIELNAVGGDVTITTGAFGTCEIDGNPLTLGRAVRIRDSGGGKVIETTTDTKLGFFGVAPVVRQGTPVTLANVIALLQAYGLAL